MVTVNLEEDDDSKTTVLPPSPTQPTNQSWKTTPHVADGTVSTNAASSSTRSAPSAEPLPPTYQPYVAAPMLPPNIVYAPMTSAPMTLAPAAYTSGGTVHAVPVRAGNPASNNNHRGANTQSVTWDTVFVRLANTTNTSSKRVKAACGSCCCLFLVIILLVWLISLFSTPSTTSEDSSTDGSSSNNGGASSSCSDTSTLYLYGSWTTCEEAAKSYGETQLCDGSSNYQTECCDTCRYHHLYGESKWSDAAVTGPSSSCKDESTTINLQHNYNLWSGTCEEAALAYGESELCDGSGTFHIQCCETCRYYNLHLQSKWNTPTECRDALTPETGHETLSSCKTAIDEYGEKFVCHQDMAHVCCATCKRLREDRIGDNSTSTTTTHELIHFI